MSANGDKSGIEAINGSIALFSRGIVIVLLSKTKVIILFYIFDFKLK